MNWAWGVLLCAILMATLSACALAQQEEEEPERGDHFSVNWEGLDLPELIRLVGILDKKKIIFDETVRGRKVNIVAKDPVPRSMIFPIFQTVLKSQGFLVTEQVVSVNGHEETLYRVVFGQQMQGIPSRLMEDGMDLPRRDELVTKVFSLRHLGAREAQASIRDLVSFPKNVFILQQANKVVVTDVAPVVEKISKVLALLDQPAPVEPVAVGPAIVRVTSLVLDVIELNHAEAETLALSEAIQ